jgi:hypothetical protein
MNTPENIKTKMPSFIWWTGQVEDVKDPLKIGRCRVRIVGQHSADKKAVPTTSLPWAHCLQPTTSAGFAGIGSSPTGLLVGSWVVGFFQDGENMQHPVIMGSFGGINPPIEDMQGSQGKAFSPPINQIEASGPLGIPSLSRTAVKILQYADQSDVNKLARGDKNVETIQASKYASLIKDIPEAINVGGGWSEPPSPYNPIYPNNKVYESKSGHVFEIDDTPTAERLHKYHRSGTFEEIHPNGTQVEKVVGDNYQIVYENDRKVVGRNLNLNVDGDANIAIRGKINIQTSGDQINIYFPNSCSVSLDTGNFVHNCHGRYTLNVRDGIIVDGQATDFNNPAYAPLKASFMDIRGIGRLGPNSSVNSSETYQKDLELARQRIFGSSSTETATYTRIRNQYIQEGVPLDQIPSPDTVEAANEVESFLEQEAVLQDSILGQIGEGVGNTINGIAQGVVDEITQGIAGAGEAGVNIALGAVAETEAFQAFQAGVAQVQQSLGLAQSIANNVQGAAGQVCAVLDMLSALKGISFGTPADFWAKMGEAVQPLAEIPEAVGEAFEQLVEGAVAAVEQFAAGIVQTFEDTLNQFTGVLDSFAGLITDPCGGGGGGLAGAGSGTIQQQISPIPTGDPTDIVDSFEQSKIEDDLSTTPLADAASMASPLNVLDTEIAKGQGGTKVAGLPVLTLPTLAGVAAFAGLGVGLAALLGGGGEGLGGPGEQGPTGPTGATGPDEEWDVLEPTKATNLEGIPAGTTFPFGLSPLEILKEILYPSLLKFNSFDIGIKVDGSKVPYHVGDSSLAGNYIATWEINDFETALENTLDIVQGENSLKDNLSSSLTEVTITHQSYSRNTEGSVDFTISVENQEQEQISRVDSLFWRYPLYAGKTAGSSITSSDLPNLVVSSTQLGGQNPFINYTMQQIKSGIALVYPPSSPPGEYLYWVVAKSVDGQSTNPPVYGLNTSFTDVSNPDVPNVIPMNKLDDISLTSYGLNIVFDVYQSTVPFSATRTIRVKQ